jgi:hypothetical protein
LRPLAIATIESSHASSQAESLLLEFGVGPFETHPFFNLSVYS